MNKALKISAITLTIFIAIGGLVILGLFGFTRLIYNQRNCSWANIDNIEMHTHTDIPDITTSNCEYIKEENVKIACFEINTTTVNIDKYIHNNLLKKLPLTTDVKFDERLKEKSKLDELRESGTFFYKVDSHNGELYQILLNSKSGQLCVYIKYKD